MTIPNPFYDVTKADAHTPQDIVNLFVRDASPIWNDIQSPINHIVVGARGSGKTMALRQLDYRTIASSEKKPEFIGVYTHVSRISAIFHTLFTKNEHEADESLKQQFQQVFADYLAIEIVRSLSNLLDDDDQLVRPDFSTVFRFPSGFRSGDFGYECTRLQIEIESSIQSWMISGKCAWRPLGDLSTIISRVAFAVRHANLWLEQNKPCIYILLDESSPIPVACQSVLNHLLLRGQPFCTKIAVRPFEWNTLETSSGRPKEQNTDVFVLHLDRSDELSDTYISQMEQIVDRVLVSRPIGVNTIRVALPYSPHYPYSGFDSICAASSGNPQDLLLLCSAIFAEIHNQEKTDHSSFKSIPPSVQHKVIRTWSQDFGRQNAYDSSRKLCHALAQKVKQNSGSSRSIGFEYRPDDPDFFEDVLLPEDLSEPLRPAFAGGFVRSGDDESMTLFDVPVRFHLSRAVLPDLDISLKTPLDPRIPLNRSFIENNARTRLRAKASRTKLEPVLYVSRSFIKPSDSRWKSLAKALQTAGFSFPKTSQKTKPPTWVHSIRRKISNSHVALLGGQDETSRAMIEVGLCASSNRPVDVVTGQFSNGDVPFQEPEGLPQLPIVTQRAGDDDFNRFAVELRALVEQLMAEPSDFTNVALTGVSLRPKRRREKTLYLSVPRTVSNRISISDMRLQLAERGWSLISEDDMTSYTANVLQISLLCAHTARIGVIDTSADDGFDAIQSYKLGLFAGKRGWRVLHTSVREPTESNPLDGVAGAEYFRWKEQTELVERILRFVSN